MDIETQVEGRYLLFKVGRKYESRTLTYAIEKALRGQPLNGEERLALTKIRIALEAHQSKGNDR